MYEDHAKIRPWSQAWATNTPRDDSSRRRAVRHGQMCDTAVCDATVLGFAVLTGNEPFVTTLVEGGVDVNYLSRWRVRSLQQCTPLAIAMQTGQSAKILDTLSHHGGVPLCIAGRGVSMTGLMLNTLVLPCVFLMSLIVGCRWSAMARRRNSHSTTASSVEPVVVHVTTEAKPDPSSSLEK